MNTPDKGLVTAAQVREILARSTSGYIVGDKVVERADFLKVWAEFNAALAPLIEREVAKARLEGFNKATLAVANCLLERCSDNVGCSIKEYLEPVRTELTRLPEEQTT